MLSLPTVLYKSPGPHAGTPVDGKSTSYDCLGVRSEAEHAAALADGWFATLGEATAPKAAELPTATVTLDEVLEAAENDEPSKAPPVEPEEAPHLADLASEESTTAKIVDLKTLARDDLKVIAKGLDGYDGRMSDEKLIALIEAAQKAG